MHITDLIIMYQQKQNVFMKKNFWPVKRYALLSEKLKK